MKNDIPGWTIKVDEFAPGVFRVTLTDKDGRIAEVVDNATDSTMDRARDYAFDIERQLKRPWNKFLYDFCMLNLVDKPLSAAMFNEFAFGSWRIEHLNRRLIYDGKDFWVVYQSRQNGEWIDEAILRNEEITYTNLMALIKRFAG